eukprot:m.156559 g.156559  ORF g.156559 m.156559 type:complete len:404 (+) comp13341_c0_seq2:112-1323(+)
MDEVVDEGPLRTTKALDVHELLEERNINDLTELLPLSSKQLERQFVGADPVSFNRLRAALRYARQQPEWLHREWNQVLTAGVVSGLVLLTYFIGKFNFSFVWAIVIAVAVSEGWRRMTDAYYKQVAFSVLRQSVKMKAAHFGETAEWFNVLVHDAWNIMLAEQLSAIIMESVNDALEAQDLGMIESLKITEVSLGNIGPVITKIQSLPSTSSRERTFDVFMSIADPNTSIIAKIKTAGISTSIAIRRLSVHAHTRFWMKLSDDKNNKRNADEQVFDNSNSNSVADDSTLSSSPQLETVHMSLLTKPLVDFGLFPIGSLDILKTIPAMDRWVRSLVVECLCELFLTPERYLIYSVDPMGFEEDEPDGLIAGTLLVNVLSGRDIVGCMFVCIDALFACGRLRLIV